MRRDRPPSKRECPKEELKEIEEGKGHSGPRMAGTVAIFLESKTVIGLNKNSKNSLEILQLPRKTPAPPGQCWDIMAQISVDTFHREGVILIMDVVNMSSRDRKSVV